MKRIEDAVSRAVNPLRDDWALRQEVSQELKLHLEESVEQLQAEGLSPEESEEKALARFGNPEEVAEELFSANFRKMKLRGKLKLAMRIAAIPLLLLALFIGFNFNLFAGLDYLLVDFTPSASRENAAPVFFFTGLGKRLAGKTKLTEEQHLFLAEDAKGGKEETAMRLRLTELYPDNPIFRAQYAIDRKLYDKEASFKEFIALEPDNAFYRYLQIAGDITRSTDYEQNDKPVWLPVIRKREEMDAAAAEYLRAIQLPRCTSYYLDRVMFGYAAYPGDDFYSITKRIDVNMQMLLPQLREYRKINHVILKYADTLIEEGKPAEAELFLNSWRPFVRHIVDESHTAIGILVANAILHNTANELPGLYAKLGKPEAGIAAAAEINAITAPINQARQRYKTGSGIYEEALRNSGFFSPLNSICAEQLLTDEDRRIDRKLSCALVDGVILSVFSFFAVTIVLLSVAVWGVMHFIFGKRGNFLFLRGREYGKLFLFGGVLPFVLYLLWLSIDTLSGRMVPLDSVFGFFLCQLAVLFIGLPSVFGVLLFYLLRKNYRKLAGNRKARLPLMVYLANMIPCWIGFVLISVSMLRIANSFEFDYYLKQDKSFLGSQKGVFKVDDLWADENRARMYKALSE